MIELNGSDDHSASHEWALRPWFYAVLLGLAGLLFHFASDNADDVLWCIAVSAALIFGPLAACFTVEADRWKQPVVLSAIVALIMAGVAWRVTSAGDHYSERELWGLAGLLFAALSLLLFKSDFHKLRWKTPYKDIHLHLLADVVSAAGALAFMGLAWLLLYLLAALFETVNIVVLTDLARSDWFIFTFSGTAFGAALGVLRNQLQLIGILKNIALLVLSLLSVPLAIALVIFFLVIAASGIDVVWNAQTSATGFLLAIAVVCFALANAVIRDDDMQASKNRILRFAAMVLALGILPLTALAAASVGLRINQYGLSPERLGLLAIVSIAVVYGAAYSISVIRGWRGNWGSYLRQSNLYLVVGTCVFALILALPIFDFGGISARNQLARLESGAVSADDFDYHALKWDFGDSGREVLVELTKSADAKIAMLANGVHQSDDRHSFQETQAEKHERVEEAIIETENEALKEAIRTYIADDHYTCGNLCHFVEVGEVEDGHLLVVETTSYSITYLVFNPETGILEEYQARDGRMSPLGSCCGSDEDYHEKSKVELRPFVGRQLYIDGRPVDEPFK